MNLELLLFDFFRSFGFFKDAINTEDSFVKRRLRYWLDFKTRPQEPFYKAIKMLFGLEFRISRCEAGLWACSSTVERSFRMREVRSSILLRSTRSLL